MEREVRGLWLEKKLLEMVSRVLSHKDVDIRSLTADRLWAVLEKIK